MRSFFNRMGFLKQLKISAIFILVITTGLFIGIYLQDLPDDQSIFEMNETEVIEDDENSEEDTEISEENDEAEVVDETPKTETSKGVSSEVSVFFNNCSIKTYGDKATALQNAINLSSFSSSREVSILAVIGYGQDIQRVRIWTESASGASNGDEYFLWSDNNWSNTMDLSAYNGTIIVTISTADSSVPPVNTYQYFSLILDLGI